MFRSFSANNISGECVSISEDNFPRLQDFLDRKGQATMGKLFPHQFIIRSMNTSYEPYQIYRNMYYITAQFGKYQNQTRPHQEETHCPPNRFRGIFFNLYLMRWTKWIAPRGLNIYHPRCSVYELTPQIYKLWYMRWRSLGYDFYHIQ